MKTKASAAPTDNVASRDLPSVEWKFDEESVANSEIIACCMWEYARESETLMEATKSTVRRDGNGLTWERTPSARKAIDQILSLPSDHSAPVYQLIAVFDGRPWANLHASERESYGHDHKQ